jgi:hypothetical protein
MWHFSHLQLYYGSKLEFIFKNFKIGGKNMEIEDVCSKIMKLTKLYKSDPNCPEGQNAYAKAKELAMKYKLNLSDFGLYDKIVLYEPPKKKYEVVPEVKKKEIIETPREDKFNVINWTKNKISNVASYTKKVMEITEQRKQEERLRKQQYELAKRQRQYELAEQQRYEMLEQQAPMKNNSELSVFSGVNIMVNPTINITINK